MKHLTLTDRSQIEKGLTVKLTFSKIGEKLGKNRTTVSREVQTYAAVVTGKKPCHAEICVH